MKPSPFYVCHEGMGDEAVAVYLRHEGMSDEAGGFTSFVTPSHAAG